MLKSKIKDTIEKTGMIKPKSTVIAALSGGADSVALVYALYQLRGELDFSLCACHVNHNLRGEESDRDEMFVRRLCRFLDIPLYVRNIRVKDFIQKHDSIEECARRLRYAFFEEISAGENGNNKLIATAHTASDNCETVLINMTRGTALSGICGIPPVRGNIIRPLLYCTRAEIEQFCRENALDYVTDSTNLCDDYTRNKIRHGVIPRLLEINPSFTDAVGRLTQSLLLDDSYLDRIARDAKKNAEKDGKYNVKLLAELDECILRRVVTMIFKESEIPVSTLAISSAVKIIRDGKGKINPCQFKFVQIRKKMLSVVTDYDKFRKSN